MIKNISPLSFVELSRKNLINNIKQFKSLTKIGTKFIVVIKGNAYGHGQNFMVQILEPYTDYFQIDSVEELRILRKVSNKEAFLFGFVQKIDLLNALSLGCILTVFSIEQLTEINKVAEKLKIRQEIHVSVDAYLGREGFLLSELPKFFQEIRKCKNIKFSGIYAHFANIEDTRLSEQSFERTTNLTHAHKQINEYKRALELAEKFGFKNLQTHISSTSGILAYEKTKGIHGLVRLGIGTYGLWPSKYLKLTYKNSDLDLKPVLSWKTKVAQVKTLPKGNTIGYGLTYKTKKETRIAIIPQGYADGVDRGLSNKGEVLIRGTKCRILGRVSMNMFVVDVSHLPKIKVEDEVVILGSQGEKKITAEGIAAKIGTINYEITTRISALLPRVVV
ncbi:alanine racemase [Candidatus Nomurabacteria bacterium RIFCSPLOWO2_12_FULL_37_8]|uniref:Alanine racemase n=1 Tax=Candidatus Nomurabacteria bacterium RIFCSPLOWO2_12_FULL_37_8 TaxID=1801793 RepID=A0A1F6Y4U2_9BACT|nr:MAG: alanine racemase [Candidatus Nomurabacteria bacterium RIFCSPLOWO2_12_FULL_37_8]